VFLCLGMAEYTMDRIFVNPAWGQSLRCTRSRGILWVEGAMKEFERLGGQGRVVKVPTFTLCRTYVYVEGFGQSRRFMVKSLSSSNGGLMVSFSVSSLPLTGCILDMISPPEPTLLRWSC
jgi:hypothetical protein